MAAMTMGVLIRVGQWALKGEIQRSLVHGDSQRFEPAVQLSSSGDRGERAVPPERAGKHASDDPSARIDPRQRWPELITDPEAAVGRGDQSLGIQSVGIGRDRLAVDVEYRFRQKVIGAGVGQTRDDISLDGLEGNNVEQLDRVTDDPEPSQRRPDIDARHDLRSGDIAQPRQVIQAVPFDRIAHLDVGTAIADRPEMSGRIARTQGQTGPEPVTHRHRGLRELEPPDHRVAPAEPFDRCRASHVIVRPDKSASINPHSLQRLHMTSLIRDTRHFQIDSALEDSPRVTPLRQVVEPDNPAAVKLLASATTPLASRSS